LSFDLPISRISFPRVLSVQGALKAGNGHEPAASEVLIIMASVKSWDYHNASDPSPGPVSLVTSVKPSVAFTAGTAADYEPGRSTGPRAKEGPAAKSRPT